MYRFVLIFHIMFDTDSTLFLGILELGYPVIGLWPIELELSRREVKVNLDSLIDLGINNNKEKGLALSMSEEIFNYEFLRQRFFIPSNLLLQRPRG